MSSSIAVIQSLEQAIIDHCDVISLEDQTYHHFAPGIYCRELRIPADVVLAGKIHKKEIMNILVKGTIRVTTPEGVKTLEAPQIFNSAPMSKKAGYTLTDTVWLNIHPTDETDLDIIEDEFIVPERTLEKGNTECLGQQ